MNLTPPGMMATMQRMNRDNLRSLARVQQEVSTPQPGAGTRRRWVDRLTNPLPCRVSTPVAADQDRLVAAKVEPHKARWVVFEEGADVLLTDRFLITMETGLVLVAYPVGGAFPRDAEIMRKLLCEVRSE